MLDTTSKYPRRIKAESMSEAIVEIARRNGFISPYVLVQDTNDYTDGYITIQAGISDAQFMESKAREYGYTFKIDGDTLRWHSPAWKSSKIVLAEKLVYGGPDIISITIDSDFQLPIPNKSTAKGHDLTNRVSLVASSEYNNTNNRYLAGGSYNTSIEQNASVRKLLTREETFAVVGGTGKGAMDKAVARLISRHMRAFQITVKCVGNPRLLANRLVKVSGTGSPFVDGTWLIAQARHTYATGDVYLTEIQLKSPPVNIMKGLTVRRVGLVGDRTYDDKNDRFLQGGNYNVVEAPAKLR
jgi:phage protein D